MLTPSPVARFRDPQGQRRPRFSFFAFTCQRTRSNCSVGGAATLATPPEQAKAPIARANSPCYPGGCPRRPAAPSVERDLDIAFLPVNNLLRRRPVGRSASGPIRSGLGDPSVPGNRRGAAPCGVGAPLVREDIRSTARGVNASTEKNFAGNPYLLHRCRCGVWHRGVVLRSIRRPARNGSSAGAGLIA